MMFISLNLLPSPTQLYTFRASSIQFLPAADHAIKQSIAHFLSFKPSCSFKTVPASSSSRLYYFPPTPPLPSPEEGLLHPQTQLPTRRPCSHPIHRGMELRHSRDRRDAFTAQLCELLATSGVNVNEAVHVADAEPLDRVGGGLLPLGAEAGLVLVFMMDGWMRSGGTLHSNPSACLVIVSDDFTRRHLLLAETCGASAPPTHSFKRMDLDGVVVARRGDLADGVERCVADAQVTVMLSHHTGRPGVPLSADFPEIPKPHVPIQ